MERTKTVLFIAPHPDDEILGCGGIIAKLKKLQKKVFVAIMTNGNIGAPDLFHIEGTIRGREEAKKSHEFLEVNDTFFYDFPALGLETFPTYKISIALDKLIKELNVDTLFLPHRGDIHKDHRVIFDAALVSARPINNTPVKRIYTYETLSETEWAAPFGDEVFYPTIFVELTEEELQQKIKAFDFYSPPRRKEYPHSRSHDGIKTLARYRGATIEKPFAEAFMLIREIFD
jgi:LmbE family N-acetylglucosaminyl deacetylase